MKKSIQQLVIMVATLLVGIEVLSGLADVFQSWVIATNNILVLLRIDVFSNPTLYWVIFFVPLLIVLFTLGVVVNWIRSSDFVKNAIPAPTPVMPPALDKQPEKNSNQVEAPGQFGKFISEFAQNLSQIISQKPLWIITLVASFLALSAFSISMPVIVSAILGIFLILTTILAFSWLVVQIVTRERIQVLETWFLINFFLITSLIGLVTFHSEGLLVSYHAVVGLQSKIAGSPNQSPDSDQTGLRPTPTPSDPVEQLNELLTMKGKDDTIRGSLIVFGVLFGLAGFLTVGNARVFGLVLGMIAGSLFGMLIGSLLSMGMAITNNLP